MLQSTENDETWGVRTLMGVHDLYTRLDEVVDAVNVEPPLSRNSRKLIVSIPFPRKMGELAETLGVTKPAFTALADDLEKQGILRRERHPDDRRAWLLALTDQGETTRRGLMEQANHFVQGVIGLDHKDQTELTRLLDLIRETNGNTECPYS